MITASMTYDEMRRIRNLDESRIYEFQLRKANELKREMRRQNVRQMTKTFEFVTPNADYFIVVGVKHGDVFASGVFIYLKETNEYIPMSRNEGYSEDCFAMSVHFLKRFVVLDPFMGSGTTARACVNLERKYVGFEIDQRQVDFANNELKNMSRQLSLF